MKLKIENRLPTLLAERGVRSAAAFGRELKTQQDYTLSSSQLTRYMQNDPPAFDLAFVSAACNVLQCLPNDLYRIEATFAADERRDPKLAFPVSAAILRESPDGAQRQVDASPALVERADDRVPSKRERAKTQTPVSTGPAAQVFPFQPKK
ncbi:MAG: helix-turn-helix transcriptional regulator [Sinobacteraceae bacterium]|nr:helix-turn-helix transcriptional regulator [Nevskiaceae bacterium]